MNQVEPVITNITKSVNKLLKEREEMREKLRKLSAEKDELKQLSSELDGRIAALENEKKTLSIAKSLTGSEDRGEAKLRINELVREIDKCIALLNK
jgi:predicted  nucleic acid-binding Zn-ribbon protein